MEGKSKGKYVTILQADLIFGRDLLDHIQYLHLVTRFLFVTLGMDIELPLPGEQCMIDDILAKTLNLFGADLIQCYVCCFI